MKRFFEKINKTDSCWLWTAATRGKTGYGAFKIDGKVIDSHRVSYTLHKGEIPEGFELIKEVEISIESEHGFGLEYQDMCFIKDLKFHSSYDWIHPVVAKIFEIMKFILCVNSKKINNIL